MNCPTNLPTLGAGYIYSILEGYTPPPCGGESTVTFCGTSALLSPGMYISHVNINPTRTYLVTEVNPPVNGRWTVKIKNVGLAPNNAPQTSGLTIWAFGLHQERLLSCDTLEERATFESLVGLSPGDPNNCCPGQQACGCGARLPLEEGLLYFVRDNQGRLVPVFTGDSGTLPPIPGDVTIGGDTTINGNLCVGAAPLDTTATPVGVTAAGCLRRVRTQRFVPENRHLLTEPMATNPPTSGTLTLTPPPGATHALIDVTVYHWDAGDVNNRAIGMLVRQNDANPFTPDDVVAFVYERNKADDDSSSDTSSGSAYIPLAATAPQIKWETRFNVPPVFTGVAYNPYRGYVFFLRGYLVEQ